MTRSTRLFHAALALVASACATPRAVRLTDDRSPALVFRDVAVFSGVGTEAQPHRDVFVLGERITHVGATGELPLPAGARVIEGAGRTLLPGLIDAHVHVQSSGGAPWKLRLPDEEANLEAFLYAGQTTVIDLGGRLEDLAKLRRRIEAGDLVGADLRYSGPHLTVPGGHPGAMMDMIVPWPMNHLLHDDDFELDDEHEITAAIARLRDGGASIAKITVDEIPLGVPKLGGALLRQAVAAAHAAGFKVAAHVGSNDDVRAVVAAGVDLLVHDVYREALAQDVIESLASARIAVAPTVGVFDAIDRLAHEGPANTPLADELTPPHIAKDIRTRPAGWSEPTAESWLAQLHQHRATRLENVKRLRDGGVVLLAGSDSANLAWQAGSALHRELDLLVEAGLSPGEALVAATRANAVVFGLNDRGTIETGRRADLLLVEGDPTADIANVHRIAGVVKAGREIVRTAPYTR